MTSPGVSTIQSGNEMRALLFSGGIDSTTIAWRLKPEKLLFVDYGQVAATGELRAARSIAKAIDRELDIRSVSLRQFGSGSMAGDLSSSNTVLEFWPYRNQALITVAAMAYADLPISSILIGTVSGDGDRHADGTAEFVETMNRLLGMQGGPMLEAPAIEVTSEQLIADTRVPLSALGWTFSCHTGEWACGTCAGCLKHDQIMQRLGQEG